MRIRDSLHNKILQLVDNGDHKENNAILCTTNTRKSVFRHKRKLHRHKSMGGTDIMYGENKLFEHSDSYKYIENGAVQIRDTYQGTLYNYNITKQTRFVYLYIKTERFQKYRVSYLYSYTYSLESFSYPFILGRAHFP